MFTEDKNVFTSIKDEVNKINNPDINSDEENNELALEQEYEKLENVKLT